MPTELIAGDLAAARRPSTRKGALNSVFAALVLAVAADMLWRTAAAWL